MLYGLIAFCPQSVSEPGWRSVITRAMTSGAGLHLVSASIVYVVRYTDCSWIAERI